MILLSYSNSSIKGTEILGSVLYLSLLRPAIFVCMQSGRKFIIFHFNSWLSFQRLCRLLQGCNLFAFSSISAEYCNLSCIISILNGKAPQVRNAIHPAVFDSTYFTFFSDFKIHDFLRFLKCCINQCSVYVPLFYVFFSKSKNTSFF